jgi:hypothetical protein
MDYYINIIFDFIKKYYLIIAFALGIPTSIYTFYFKNITKPAAKTAIQFKNCKEQLIKQIDLQNPSSPQNANIGIECIKNIQPDKNDIKFIQEDLINKE